MFSLQQLAEGQSPLKASARISSCWSCQQMLHLGINSGLCVERTVLHIWRVILQAEGNLSFHPEMTRTVRTMPDSSDYSLAFHVLIGWTGTSTAVMAM